MRSTRRSAAAAAADAVPPPVVASSASKAEAKASAASPATDSTAGGGVVPSNPTVTTTYSSRSRRKSSGATAALSSPPSPGPLSKTGPTHASSSSNADATSIVPAVTAAPASTIATDVHVENEKHDGISTVATSAATRAAEAGADTSLPAPAPTAHSAAPGGTAGISATDVTLRSSLIADTASALNSTSSPSIGPPSTTAGASSKSLSALLATAATATMSSNTAISNSTSGGGLTSGGVGVASVMNSDLTSSFLKDSAAGTKRKLATEVTTVISPLLTSTTSTSTANTTTTRGSGVGNASSSLASHLVSGSGSASGASAAVDRPPVNKKTRGAMVDPSRSSLGTCLPDDARVSSAVAALTSAPPGGASLASVVLQRMHASNAASNLALLSLSNGMGGLPIPSQPNNTATNASGAMGSPPLLTPLDMAASAATRATNVDFATTSPRGRRVISKPAAINSATGSANAATSAPSLTASAMPTGGVPLGLTSSASSNSTPRQASSSPMSYSAAIAAQGPAGTSARPLHGLSGGNGTTTTPMLVNGTSGVAAAGSTGSTFIGNPTSGVSPSVGNRVIMPSQVPTGNTNTSTTASGVLSSLPYGTGALSDTAAVGAGVSMTATAPMPLSVNAGVSAFNRPMAQSDASNNAPAMLSTPAMVAPSQSQLYGQRAPGVQVPGSVTANLGANHMINIPPMNTTYANPSDRVTAHALASSTTAQPQHPNTSGKAMNFGLSSQLAPLQSTPANASSGTNGNSPVGISAPSGVSNFVSISTGGRSTASAYNPTNSAHNSSTSGAYSSLPSSSLPNGMYTPTSLPGNNVSTQYNSSGGPTAASIGGANTALSNNNGISNAVTGSAGLVHSGTGSESKPIGFHTELSSTQLLPAQHPIQSNGASAMSGPTKPPASSSKSGAGVAPPASKSPPASSNTAVLGEGPQGVQQLNKRLDAALAKLASMERKAFLGRKGFAVSMPRQKTQRDYLLEEVLWMSIDFRQERRWKQSMFKAVAYACADSQARRRFIEPVYNEEINVADMDRSMSPLSVGSKVRRNTPFKPASIKDRQLIANRIARIVYEGWYDAAPKDVNAFFPAESLGNDENIADLYHTNIRATQARLALLKNDTSLDTTMSNHHYLAYMGAFLDRCIAIQRQGLGVQVHSSSQASDCNIGAYLLHLWRLEVHRHPAMYPYILHNEPRQRVNFAVFLPRRLIFKWKNDVDNFSSYPLAQNSSEEMGDTMKQIWRHSRSTHGVPILNVAYFTIESLYDPNFVMPLPSRDRARYGEAPTAAADGAAESWHGVILDVRQECKMASKCASTDGIQAHSPLEIGGNHAASFQNDTIAVFNKKVGASLNPTFRCLLVPSAFPETLNNYSPAGGSVGRDADVQLSEGAFKFITHNLRSHLFTAPSNTASISSSDLGPSYGSSAHTSANANTGGRSQAVGVGRRSSSRGSLGSSASVGGELNEMMDVDEPTNSAPSPLGTSASPSRPVESSAEGSISAIETAVASIASLRFSAVPASPQVQVKPDPGTHKGVDRLKSAGIDVRFVRMCPIQRHKYDVILRDALLSSPHTLFSQDKEIRSLGSPVFSGYNVHLLTEVLMLLQRVCTSPSLVIMGDVKRSEDAMLLDAMSLYSQMASLQDFDTESSTETTGIATAPVSSSLAPSISGVEVLAASSSIGSAFVKTEPRRASSIDSSAGLDASKTRGDSNISRVSSKSFDEGPSELSQGKHHMFKFFPGSYQFLSGPVSISSSDDLAEDTVMEGSPSSTPCSKLGAIEEHIMCLRAARRRRMIVIVDNTTDSDTLRSFLKHRLDISPYVAVEATWLSSDASPIFASACEDAEQSLPNAHHLIGHTNSGTLVLHRNSGGIVKPGDEASDQGRPRIRTRECMYRDAMLIENAIYQFNSNASLDDVAVLIMSTSVAKRIHSRNNCFASIHVQPVPVDSVVVLSWDWNEGDIATALHRLQYKTALLLACKDTIEESLVKVSDFGSIRSDSGLETVGRVVDLRDQTCLSAFYGPDYIRYRKLIDDPDNAKTYPSLSLTQQVMLQETMLTVLNPSLNFDLFNRYRDCHAAPSDVGSSVTVKLEASAASNNSTATTAAKARLITPEIVEHWNRNLMRKTSSAHAFFVFCSTITFNRIISASFQLKPHDASQEAGATHSKSQIPVRTNSIATTSAAASTGGSSVTTAAAPNGPSSSTMRASSVTSQPLFRSTSTLGAGIPRAGNGTSGRAAGLHTNTQDSFVLPETIIFGNSWLLRLSHSDVKFDDEASILTSPATSNKGDAKPHTSSGANGSQRMPNDHISSALAGRLAHCYNWWEHFLVHFDPVDNPFETSEKVKSENDESNARQFISVAKPNPSLVASGGGVVAGMSHRLKIYLLRGYNHYIRMVARTETFTCSSLEDTCLPCVHRPREVANGVPRMLTYTSSPWQLEFISRFSHFFVDNSHFSASCGTSFGLASYMDSILEMNRVWIHFNETKAMRFQKRSTSSSFSFKGVLSATVASTDSSMSLQSYFPESFVHISTSSSSDSTDRVNYQMHRSRLMSISGLGPGSAVGNVTSHTAGLSGSRIAYCKSAETMADSAPISLLYEAVDMTATTAFTASNPFLSSHSQGPAISAAVEIHRRIRNELLRQGVYVETHLLLNPLQTSAPALVEMQKFFDAQQMPLRKEMTNAVLSSASNFYAYTASLAASGSTDGIAEHKSFDEKISHDVLTIADKNTPPSWNQMNTGTSRDIIVRNVIPQPQAPPATSKHSAVGGAVSSGISSSSESGSNKLSGGLAAQALATASGGAALDATKMKLAPGAGSTRFDSKKKLAAAAAVALGISAGMKLPMLSPAADVAQTAAASAAVANLVNSYYSHVAAISAQSAASSSSTGVANTDSASGNGSSSANPTDAASITKTKASPPRGPPVYTGPPVGLDPVHRLAVASARNMLNAHDSHHPTSSSGLPINPYAPKPIRFVKRIVNPVRESRSNDESWTPDETETVRHLVSSLGENWSTLEAALRYGIVKQQAFAQSSTGGTTSLGIEADVPSSHTRSARQIHDHFSKHIEPGLKRVGSHKRRPSEDSSFLLLGGHRALHANPSLSVIVPAPATSSLENGRTIRSDFNLPLTTEPEPIASKIQELLDRLLSKQPGDVVSETVYSQSQGLSASMESGTSRKDSILGDLDANFLNEFDSDAMDIVLPGSENVRISAPTRAASLGSAPPSLNIRGISSGSGASSANGGGNGAALTTVLPGIGVLLTSANKAFSQAKKSVSSLHEQVFKKLRTEGTHSVLASHGAQTLPAATCLPPHGSHEVAVRDSSSSASLDPLRVAIKVKAAAAAVAVSAPSSSSSIAAAQGDASAGGVAPQMLPTSNLGAQQIDGSGMMPSTMTGNLNSSLGISSAPSVSSQGGYSHMNQSQAAAAAAQQMHHKYMASQMAVQGGAGNVHMGMGIDHGHSTSSTGSVVNANRGASLNMGPANGAIGVGGLPGLKSLLTLTQPHATGMFSPSIGNAPPPVRTQPGGPVGLAQYPNTLPADQAASISRSNSGSTSLGVPPMSSTLPGGMTNSSNSSGGAMNYGSTLVGSGQPMQTVPQQGSVIHSGTSPAAQQTIPNYASMLQRASQMASSANGVIGSASAPVPGGNAGGAISPSMRMPMQLQQTGYASMPGSTYASAPGQSSVMAMQSNSSVAGNSMSSLGVARLPTVEPSPSNTLPQQQQQQP